MRGKPEAGTRHVTNSELTTDIHRWSLAAKSAALTLHNRAISSTDNGFAAFVIRNKTLHGFFYLKWDAFGLAFWYDSVTLRGPL